MSGLKKLLSLFLALCLICSLTATFVSAETEELETYTVDAKEIMEGGEGVGFHTTSEQHGDGTSDCLELWQGGGIILRTGEWTAYKLPENLKPGMYSLTINAANCFDSYVDVWVNGLKTSHMLKLEKTLTPDGKADGSYSNYTKRQICNVYLSGNEDVIQIGNIRNFTNIVNQAPVSHSRDYTRTIDGVSETVTYGSAFTFKDFTLDYVSADVTIPISFDGYEAVEHTLNNALIGFVSGNSLLPNKMLILRPGTLASYNISSLPEGEYELSIKGNTSSDRKFDIHLSDKAGDKDDLMLDDITFTGVGNGNTYVTRAALGNIIITEADKYLEISSDAHGLSIDYIVLKRVASDIVYKKHYDEPVDYYKSSMEEHPTWTIHETITSGKLIRDGVEIDDLPITLRQQTEDYYTFDISFLKPGVYNLKLERATTSNYYCDIYTFSDEDEQGTIKKVAADTVIPKTSDWVNLAVSDTVATFSVDKGTTRLKITPNSGSAIKLANFVFERVATEDRRDYILYCDETINAVPGEGFKAGDKDALEPAIEVTRKYDAIMMRSGYWTAYDVANIPSGIYDVYTCVATYYGSPVTLNLDGKDVIKAEIPITNSTAYNPGMTTFAEIKLGTVTIDANSELLKLTSGGNFNFKTLIFKPKANTKVYDADGKVTKQVTDGQMTTKTFLNNILTDEEVLYVFAIYKKDVASGNVTLYKVYAEMATGKDVFEGYVTGIEQEEGYEYFQKIFALSSGSLNGYGF